MATNIKPNLATSFCVEELMRFSVKLAALISASCLFVTGCGPQGADYSMVDLVNVGGNVTLDDKPLANAVVTFEDPTDDTFSYGLTDANGNYQLQFDSDMSGVKVGKKVVRISTTKKILGLNSKPGQEQDTGEAGEPKKTGELVPAKYNKQSELNADVTKSTTKFDFKLSSAK